MGVFRDPKKSLSSIPTPRNRKEDPGRDFFPLQALETLPKMIITRCTNDFLLKPKRSKMGKTNKPGEVTTVYIYIDIHFVYIYMLNICMYMYIYIHIHVQYFFTLPFFLGKYLSYMLFFEEHPTLARHLPQKKNVPGVTKNISQSADGTGIWVPTHVEIKSFCHLKLFFWNICGF